MTPVRQETSERLLQAIHDKTFGSSFEMAELEHPEFSEEARWSSWSYYVPSELQAMWSELSTESRLVAVIGALERYDRDDGPLF